MTRTLHLFVLALVAGCAGTATQSSSPSADAKPAQSGTPAKTATAAKAPAAPPRDRLEDSPLVWKPTSSTAAVGAVDLTGLSNLKLQIAPLADGRDNPKLLGQNREKSPARKITTQDDVPAFVTRHMKELMASNGINVVDASGNRVLKGTLKQFYVDETDTYKGEVRMAMDLTDAQGKTLWTGVTGGTSTRFGRSYKAENYYETLSDALIDATSSLLKNEGFRAALMK